MALAIKALIKIDFGEGVRLGEGKIALLHHIAATGSISAAARAMDMSYRKAWLLINEMNQMFGLPVIATAAGGSGGGGATLTDHGHKLMATFQALQSEVDHLVESKMKSFT